MSKEIDNNSSDNTLLFLKELINDYNENKLSDSMSLEISNLYVKHQLCKRGMVDLDIINETDEKKIMKYLTLGWYIYNSVNETVNSHSDTYTSVDINGTNI